MASRCETVLSGEEGDDDDETGEESGRGKDGSTPFPQYGHSRASSGIRRSQALQRMGCLLHNLPGLLNNHFLPVLAQRGKAGVPARASVDQTAAFLRMLFLAVNFYSMPNRLRTWAISPPFCSIFNTSAAKGGKVYPPPGVVTVPAAKSIVIS